jgi:hypothetical protein
VLILTVLFNIFNLMGVSRFAPDRQRRRGHHRRRPLVEAAGATKARLPELLRFYVVGSVVANRLSPEQSASGASQSRMARQLKPSCRLTKRLQQDESLPAWAMTTTAAIGLLSGARWVIGA